MQKLDQMGQTIIRKVVERFQAVGLLSFAA